MLQLQTQGESLTKRIWNKTIANVGNVRKVRSKITVDFLDMCLVENFLDHCAFIAYDAQGQKISSGTFSLLENRHDVKVIPESTFSLRKAKKIYVFFVVRATGRRIGKVFPL